MSFFVFSRDTPQNVQLIRWSGLCELIAGFLGSIVVQLSESMVNSWLVGLPDISNNAGSVKLFLSRLVPSLLRVVFLVFFDPLHRRPRLVCNLSGGLSPTQTSRVLSSALFRRVKVPLALG